jgi:fermentation-respiration switch protein FrsA (DUF1100 family)
MRREDVEFQSQGTRCAAWLYRPGAPAPHPVVVMAHGLGGVREARLDAYAERFARAGMAVLVFDYRHFGASGGGPRQLLDIGMQHDDWQAAIALAAALPGIDPKRIAIWGTSFSGGHVLWLGARRSDIAAIVAQCPAADCFTAVLKIPPLQSLRLFWAGIKDGLRGLFGLKPLYIGTAGAPGTLAAMTTPDALPGYMKLVPPGSSFRNEIAGRIMLKLALYRPGAKAASISAPLLVCVCDDDAIVLPKAAARAAARAKNGTAIHYSLGHFDIYVGDAFERAVADQTAFLIKELKVAAPVRAVA